MATANDVAAPAAYANNNAVVCAFGPEIAAPVRTRHRIGPAQGAHKNPVATPSSSEGTNPTVAPAPAADGINRLPTAPNGRAIQSASRRDSKVAANTVNSAIANRRPYWLTRTAQAPPTAAKVAMPANVTAIPANRGNPLVRNVCSYRAKTNCNTGRMQGLNMVSTPPRNTRSTNVISSNVRICGYRPRRRQIRISRLSPRAL